MTYKTHFIGGICAAAVAASILTNIGSPFIMIGVSAFSALIPDIDIARSKVGKKAGFVSGAVSSFFGHRGFIHTPVLYIVISFIISLILPVSVIYGFLIGTFSHLILDTFNKKGIMWLYPLTKKHYHIANIKTRGFGENAFMFVMIVVACFYIITTILGGDTKLNLYHILQQT